MLIVAAVDIRGGGWMRLKRLGYHQTIRNQQPVNQSRTQIASLSSLYKYERKTMNHWYHDKRCKNRKHLHFVKMCLNRHCPWDKIQDNRNVWKPGWFIISKLPKEYNCPKTRKCAFILSFMKRCNSRAQPLNPWNMKNYRRGTLVSNFAANCNF